MIECHGEKCEKNTVGIQLDPSNLYMASSSNKQTIVDVYLNHVIIDGVLE
jgi:hypothetical protein